MALLALPVQVMAQDWQPVPDEAGVRATLEGRKLTYDSGAWQDFRASGKTLYNSGRDSWGNWRAQGAQYCSQWPPAGDWACYDLLTSGDKVRFVGAGGDVTDGTYTD